jgi:hypothetical protein
MLALRAWRGDSREARSVLVGPGPRQQFIEFLHWPAIDQLGEDIGQISLRVDSVNGASGLERCGMRQLISQMKNQ